MALDARPERGSISPEHGSPQQDQVDRQMIRHLLGRYSREELGRLLQEEGRSSLSSCNTGSPVLSGINSSSRNSQDDASRTLDSDTSSACGSVASNVSPRASHSHCRKRNASPTTARSSMALTDDSSWEAEDATPTTAAPKQKGSFTCGFCLEEGIQKTCTRKNDLKRHMEDFHHTDSQWFCRHRGCQMVFDWQTAYKAHLKNCHGGSRMNLEDAKVALCPQTVFACGFENCLQVFEANSDAEVGATFKEYVSHIVKHFDEVAGSGHWSYSARMRNLLRQSSVLGVWSQTIWPETEQNRLQWNTQSSSVLRKRLETRHLGDIQFLVQYAIALGSSPSATIHSFRPDFVTPIWSECRLAIQGHRGGISSAVPTAESDHMQYSMSTSGANPAMVAYYQRQAYMSQQPAQPPMHSQAYSFHNPPPSPRYDAHHQAVPQRQQQQQQQHYMGITDTQMSDYVPHGLPNIPGAYEPNGVTSPAPTDMCTAGTASPGSTIEQRTTYAAYSASPYAAY